ncbi:MAG: heavy metal translocating P-type ATPase [Ruminococcaceae bacterium]|nr:heavy metal translocating P-type ATPase [Oscillospiraceae bacterium]
MKQNFEVSGMSCAACSARVEKAVSNLDGVEKCSVNLLTGTMTTEGSASHDEIIAAVENAGYGARLAGKEKQNKRANENHEKNELKDLKNRIIASVIFLCALMYISMGHMMWNWPLPAVLAKDHVAMGICQLILSVIIMVINQRFFVSGFKAIINRAPNMDSLVALGSGAAFVYSTFALFAMSGAREAGNIDAVMDYMHEFYFESAAMILTLITVGKMLEAFSKGKTTDALKGLMELTPKKAVVIRNGKETEIDASDMELGDVFIVKPGESIAADGIVIDGSSAVDESALTGESVPVDKTIGSKVSAATINKYGHLKCKATGVGEETSLAKIIKMVSEASAGKAPIAKIADRVSGVFVPIVMTIAIITIIVWLTHGESIGYALARGISVLVISCPCALGLATPVAIMVGSGVGARHGILFKTAESLETTGKIKICVFDKTGTITKGEPEVTDIVCAEGYTESELIGAAYSLEKMSEHPLSNAIVGYGKQKGIESKNITEFEIQPGSGLYGKLGDDVLRAGNSRYIEQFAKIDAILATNAELLANSGKTPLFFSKNDRVLGIIAVADTLKPDSAEAIEKIKKMGIKTVMLTGDNQKTAETIGKMCGVERIIPEVMPDEKEKIIRDLQKNMSVAMVGDGINDAPALTAADVGIAIGAGTDIAIDAADVVVTGSTLSDVASAIVLSKKTLRNIKQNLFWAFCYNVIGIPLAAGAWISLLGWEMNPMFGAAAMSLSSFCVVTNALRLNFAKIKSDIKIETNNKKGNDKMIKEVKIEGMMCPHCEARVKKVLEEIDGVESVTASHETKTATIVSSKEIADETIKAIIEEQGYKVI